MSEASDRALRALRARLAAAGDMPDVLRIVADEVAAPGTLIEQVVSVLLAARDAVAPYADFESAEGTEWQLWQVLDRVAEDLGDRRIEITGPLGELGFVPKGGGRG